MYQCTNYHRGIKYFSVNSLDCSGPFGTCTQADKTRLGYASIKKLHEKMDEDKDGELEVHETKEVKL